MSARQEFKDEFIYFMSVINFKDSVLDCRAIQFMNTFENWLDQAIKEDRNEVHTN